MLLLCRYFDLPFGLSQINLSQRSTSHESPTEVYCSTDPEGTLPNRIDFARFILKVERAVSNKGIPLTLVTGQILTVSDRIKQTEKILTEVNNFLSPLAQNTFATAYTITPFSENLSIWEHIRKILMRALGAVLVSAQIQFKAGQYIQKANQSPSDYYYKLIEWVGSVHTAMDKEYGDGTKWSGRNYPANLYPFYGMKERFVLSTEFKSRVFSGFDASLVAQFHSSFGGLTMSGAQLRMMNCDELLHWFESAWVTRYQKADATPKVHSALPDNSGSNDMNDHTPFLNATRPKRPMNEEDNFDSFNSAGAKRSKDNSLSESSRSDISLALERIAQMTCDATTKNANENRDFTTRVTNENREFLASILDRFTPSTPRSSWFAPVLQENKIGDEPPHRLHAVTNAGRVNRGAGPTRPRTAKIIPTRGANASARVCWICKGAHYAPQCPYIARLELLIMLSNRLYRSNRNNPNTNTHSTLESLCKMESVPPPTETEIRLLSVIYQPLIDGIAKKVLGLNPSAYCHYCHASGHWTRDCTSFCPYCQLAGHGWKACTNPIFRTIIENRVGNGANPNINAALVDHVFTLCTATNDDTENFIDEFDELQISENY